MVRMPLNRPSDHSECCKSISSAPKIDLTLLKLGKALLRPLQHPSNSEIHVFK